MENRKILDRRIICMMIFLAFFVFLQNASVMAETAKKNTTKTTKSAKTTKGAKKTKKNTGKWKEKHQYFFYVRNGKRLRGMHKIQNKYYLFDERGRQQVGWRLVKGKYRYFRIKNGKQGYMINQGTVNGIPIRKGVASENLNFAKKLELLVRFQELADQLVRPGVNKKTKLIVAFKFARDKPYRSLDDVYAVGRWDEAPAEVFLNANYADCVVAACGFAYLANAVGYKNVSLRLYGHSHCEINRRIYDPGFAKTVSDDQYTRFFNKAYEELPAWYTGDETPTRFV